MPGYRTHLAGGICAYGIGLYLLYSHCTSYNTGIEWLLFALAGSLFPDIDVKSKGQHYFYWLIFFIFGLLIAYHYYTLVAYISVITLMPLLVRHRGIFHRLWFVICIPLLGWFIVSKYQPAVAPILLHDTFFFIGGAISHIWLDIGLRRMLRF